MMQQEQAFKQILIADDDADDCVLFEDALRTICKQTKLSVANDGEQLMILLGKSFGDLPDTIFLDVNMPCKNGFECLEEIRGSAQLRHIPVVMFSTTAHEQSVVEAFKKGANYYIQKPTTFTGLQQLVKKVLNMNWEQNATLQNFIILPENEK